MKILFAAPDRDLLECYKKLLESDLCEIETAFDGTQVFSLLSEEKYDAVILDRNVPRIDHKKMIARIREERIPVIVLCDSPVGARQLTEEPLPNAYLSYPFTSKKLTAAVIDMIEKAESGTHFDFFGTDVDTKGFNIVSGPDLTSGEIDVLRSLNSGAHVGSEYGTYVGALNEKLSRAGSKVRIKYKTKKGFEPVNEDE